MDLVSIIIPSFNRESLIKETLDSLISQTYPNWEALVVDDGSTDATCDVVQGYSGKDKRINLIRRKREPKGASVCRNIGIENAIGEYIIFLDSDDILTPNCLENRISFFEQYPDLDFAVFQMGVLSHDGHYKSQKIIKKKSNYLYSFLSHDLPWTITGPIWKTIFIKNEIIGFNETYPRLQDPEFHTRALMVEGVKFHVLADSEPDCYYRAHSDKVFNVSILLNGFLLYIQEFLEKTSSRADSEQCKFHLKRSYIEAIRGFYSYNKGNFTNENLVQLKQISDFSYKNKIIKYRTKYLTSVLIFLYRIRIDKLILGKYVLRLIMKLIKEL